VLDALVAYRVLLKTAAAATAAAAAM